MKSLTVSLALLVASGGWLTAAELSDKRKTSETEIIFPRFDGGTAEIERNPELEKALQAVPTLKFKGPLFPFSFGGKKENIDGLTVRIEFDPAKADLGDVVKAVAAVPGPEGRKNQPAAIVMVRTDLGERLKSEQLESLWKHLAKVKGVDVDASRQLEQGQILGIVPDGSGNVRLQAIVDAVMATGAKVQDPRELD